MDKYLMIKQLFEANKDSENALKMAKYMQNKFSFYGIPTPKRKKLYRDFLKAEKKNKKIDFALLDLCFQDEYREFQYFGCDYLKVLQAFLVYEDIDKLKQYLLTKQWWDVTDSLDIIIGNIGLKDKRVDSLMIEWSLNEDIWLKRVAIDHQLLRKEKTNQQLLEKIIVNNLNSDEFFINKAIGWSLRDYSKTDPQWVKTFIEKYHDQMAKLSIKEASKYLGD